MSLINISNLTFAYDGSYDNIFENVSLQLDTDWKLGLTGRNGRGKTTLLKLLLGQYEYRGNISANARFEYFPYEVNNKSENTLDVLEQIHPDLQYWQLSREMNALEIDESVLYRPFGTLSNGEQTKLLLAALFLKENNFLLIDEPTNHLDYKGRELVSNYLSTKKGFILVSHDRTFLDGCVDHILSINKANIELQRGNFTTWLENKERQDNFELAENEKLRKEIKRLRESAREKAEWSDRAERQKIGIDPLKVDNKKGHRAYQAMKAKKMMKRSKAIEQRQQNAIEEKTKLLKNIDYKEDLKLTQLDHHAQRLASFRELSVKYSAAPVFENISFNIEKGDRIALLGRNGSGKSSILKLICELDIPHTGSFERSSGLVVSYVVQDTSALCGTLSGYAAACKIDETLYKTILRKLDFTRAQFDKDMRDFSGGQKKKALIARSLCERAHIYVWDEPMNYIDIISRMQIEELLLKFKPTILFAEHDKAFVGKIATKIIEL